MRRIALLVAIAMANVIAAHAADEVRITVGDVVDSRTTGKFFASCKVELKPIGDAVAEASGLRVRVTAAIDDTGRDLIDPEKQDDGSFTAIDRRFHPEPRVELELKNPARAAKTIARLTGTIDLYVPKRDPQSIANIAGVMGQLGTPIADAKLAAAAVTIAVFDRAAQEAAKKAPKKAVKPAAKDLGDAIGEAFAGAMGGSMMTLDENGIEVRIEDPGHRVIGFRFVDAAGAEIDRSSMMSMGTDYFLDFQQPMPKDAALVVELATDQALISVQFALTDVPLP